MLGSNGVNEVLGWAHTIRVIERLGNQGLVVSICYGTYGNKQTVYMVQVLDTSTGFKFDEPLAVKSFGEIGPLLGIEVPKLLERSAREG